MISCSFNYFNRDKIYFVQDFTNSIPFTHPSDSKKLKNVEVK